MHECEQRIGMSRGFTLLELMMVIAILAVLSVAAVLVINPAEILSRTRDATRISDIQALVAAIEVYEAESSAPHLGGGTDANCLGDASGMNTTARIFYSAASVVINDTSDPVAGVGADAAGANWNGPLGQVDIQPASSSAAPVVDGSGWLPLDFTTVSVGVPIEKLPVDPLNEVANTSGATNTDFVYRYACDMSDAQYEINAVLESNRYAPRMVEDGGDNDFYYEAGKSLRLLPPGPSVDF